MTSVSYPKAALSYLPTQVTAFFNRGGAAPLPRRIYIVGIAILGGLGLIYGIRHYIHHRNLADMAAQRVNGAGPEAEPMNDAANRTNQVAVDEFDHLEAAAA